MQGKDISGLSVQVFMGPCVKCACTTNLVKEGKWWRYPKSAGAALHCSGADFNPRCEERTPWFPKLAEGCPHSTATPSQGHTAEPAHDPSSLCFFKYPHLKKSAYALRPKYILSACVFPPMAALLPLRTGQAGGCCRKRWSLPHPRSWKRSRRTACTVSTCIICPICSHLVLLKFLISQPGLIYAARAAAFPSQKSSAMVNVATA